MVTQAFRHVWNDPEVVETLDGNIERYRKSDVTIHVMDISGNPLSKATVTIEQLSHHFLFGSNAFVLGQLATPEANAKYERAFVKVFLDERVTLFAELLSFRTDSMELGAYVLPSRRSEYRFIWCEDRCSNGSGIKEMVQEFLEGWDVNQFSKTEVLHVRFRQFYL